ncbi:MAG TPA: hypothetical protein VLE89_04700 [Chlamydiales bacterium]|nr:hypothetical protein [Chlamydiales bacterium]
MSISALSATPRFQNITDETIAQETAPISDIVEGFSPTDQRIQFCYLVAERALRALLNRDYNHFDAKTTSNCCHGMSLLARELICKAQKYDLGHLYTEIRKILGSATSLDSNYQIPVAIQQLSQMYMLNYIREIDSFSGGRSVYNKLKEIEPSIGHHVYSSLGIRLQKKYSNLVANRYQKYSDGLPGDAKIKNIPIKSWAKYVSPSYLRTDSKGIEYAPCMFSMQVSLGHLINQRAKIAIINDIHDPSGELGRKYIKVLEGNGSDNFVDISQELQLDEPVTVFSGSSTNSNPDKVSEHMDRALKDFPMLVLACDTSYPQFPNAVYDNNPIVPEEESLCKMIEVQGTVKGVSAKDPSFFCLNHIYLCSANQIRNTMDKKDGPISYRIPTDLQSQ